MHLLLQSYKNQFDYYQVGNIFHKKPNISQEEILNGAIYGNKIFEKWINSNKDNNLNYYEARGKLKEALAILNLSHGVSFERETQALKFLGPKNVSPKIYFEIIPYWEKEDYI